MQAPVEPLNTLRVKPLSLRKNFTWTFAGNMIYAASQWGVLVVLAKLGSPEVVGQFALGLAICAPVILFANLQLRSVQATDARHEYTFADYLGLRLMTTLVAYLGIIGIVILSGYRQETVLVILFIGLAKSFEAVSDVIFGLLQQHERMDRIAKSLMIEGPVTLVVMGIVLYLTGSVVWATASMAAVWGLQLVLYDFRSALLIFRGDSPGNEWRLIRPRVHLHTLRRLSWLALPLGFVAMLISLNTNIPRIFVERYLGEAQLGIFTAMAYLIVAGNVVVGALGQSASPRLATYYARADRYAYSRLLLRLLAIGASLGLAGVILAIVAGEWILNLLYGPEYAATSGVFVWIMIAGGIMYVGSFLGYGITATRQFQRFAAPYIINTIVIAFSAFILIPTYGLNGAAWVLCISGLMSCITPIFILLTIKDSRWIVFRKS